MDNPSLTYTPRPDTTPEAELNALAAVYRFILDCHAKKKVAEPDSRNDTAIVTNTKEVSHVEQRLDRPSETTHTQLHSSPLIRGLIRPGGNSLLGKER